MRPPDIDPKAIGAAHAATEIAKFDRYKNLVLNTLAVGPYPGVPEDKLITQLLAGSRDPTDPHWCRSAIRSLISESKVSRYRMGGVMYIKKSGRSETRPLPSRPPTLSSSTDPSALPHSNTSAVSKRNGITAGHDPQGWKPFIMRYIESEESRKRPANFTTLMNMVAQRTKEPGFDLNQYYNVWNELLRDKEIQLGGHAGHQTITKASSLQRSAGPETIDLTNGTDDAWESSNRTKYGQSSSSRSMPWATGKSASVKREHRDSGLPDPSFSQAKVEWTRRTLREFTGWDETKTFEVLRLVIPSLRTTARQQLRVEDISIECLRKLYRYFQHLELEAPPRGSTTHTVPSLTPLAKSQNAQPKPPREAVENAILGATNKQLCDTLLELCKSSDALSRAILRSLAPEGNFAQSTLKFDSPGEAARHQITMLSAKGNSFVKPEPGIKPELGRSVPSSGPSQRAVSSPSFSSSAGPSGVDGTPRIKPEPGTQSFGVQRRTPSSFKSPAAFIKMELSNLSTSGEDLEPEAFKSSDSGPEAVRSTNSSSTEAGSPSAPPAIEVSGSRSSSFGKRPVTRTECTRCKQPFDPADNRAYDCRSHTGDLIPDWDDPYWQENGISDADGQPPDLQAHPHRLFSWTCCGHPRSHAGCQKVAHEEADCG